MDGTDSSAERLLELAQPAAGEHVADIGCGAGGSARALYERVGPRGSVLGIDISASLIAAARERVHGVRFVAADAARHRFAARGLDLVFSQFGMTFFTDPVAAFGRFHGALASTGRIAFACFGPITHNAWADVVFGLARELVPRWRPPPLDDRGPFAFHQRERLGLVLDAAGFHDVRCVLHAMTERLGATPADAVARVLARPFIAASLATLEREARHELPARLAAAFAAFAKGGAVIAPAAAWLVTARATASPRRTARAYPSAAPSPRRPRRRRRARS
ncbi:MAG TPA: methyltransferase domain-containing protein [Kofleriaceae bacterium]